MMYNVLIWWGYRHVNGHIQVKRYFHPMDIKEAMESDFVEDVCGPFEADDRSDAKEIAAKRLGVK